MSAREQLPPAMITFLVVDTIAVGLRVWTRSALSKSLGYDDWSMVVAFLSYVALCGTTFVTVNNGFGSDDPVTYSPLQLMTGAKFFAVSTLLYIIVLFLVKVSIALVLYRLASNNKPMRRVIEATLGVMTVCSLVFCILIGLQCRPLSAAWGETVGECMPTSVLSNIGYSITAMDIVTGVEFIVLPVILLRDVQLNMKTKVSVLALLSLGIVSSIASILRLKSLVDLTKVKNPTDPGASNLYLSTFIYSMIELGIAIFAASLAALRPLLKFVPFGKTEAGTYGRKKYPSKNSRDEMGPSIPLEEHNGPEPQNSQEQIVPKGRVMKHSHYEVQYTNA